MNEMHYNIHTDPEVIRVLEHSNKLNGGVLYTRPDYCEVTR